MWKCTQCNKNNEDTLLKCSSCTTIKPDEPPSIIKYANIIGSLNIIYIIVFGVIHFSQINILTYLLVTAAFIVANVGLWKMKLWGLYFFIGTLLITIFLGGLLDIHFNASGAVIASVIYIYKVAWLD